MDVQRANTISLPPCAQSQLSASAAQHLTWPSRDGEGYDNDMSFSDVEATEDLEAEDGCTLRI